MKNRSKRISTSIITLLFMSMIMVSAQTEYKPLVEITQTETDYHVSIAFFNTTVSIINYSITLTSMPSVDKIFTVFSDIVRNRVGFDIKKEIIPENDTHLAVSVVIGFDPPLIEGVDIFTTYKWTTTFPYSEIPLEAATAEELLPVLILGGILMVLIIPLIVYQRRKKLMVQAKKIPIVKDVMKRLR